MGNTPSAYLDTMDLSDPAREAGWFFFKDGRSHQFLSSPVSVGKSSTPAFLAAEADHPIVQSWSNGLGEKIIDLLKDHSFEFDAVDCLRRPRAFSALRDFCVSLPNDHFVVITVRQKITDGFHLRPMMEKIFKLAEGLTVEVRRGAVDFFTPPVQIGSSIALVGDPTANGSLGGFINLVKDDGTIVAECVLTCEHVIRFYLDGKKKGMEKQMSRPWDFWSEPYDVSKDPVAAPCDSPSHAWHREYVSRKQRELMLLEAEIQAYKYSDDEETFPKNELRTLRYRRTRLRNETYDEMEIDRSLGALYVSSGYGFSRHGHRLDWALVRVHDDRLPITQRNKTRACGELGIRSHEILDSVKPQRNAKVYKQGLTTGTTVGVVNPIQSYVVTWSPAGKRNVVPEWCVVSENSKNFAQEGDSGSLVLERQTGNAMGMVFGGHLHGGPVYFTSITAIATDVERLTGSKMQFPEGSIIGE